jgi:F0F1-type ATP synthase assembly protein I
VARAGKHLELWAQIGFYTSLGFIVPAGAVAGCLIGWLLDRWLKTAPVLIVVMGFLGAAGGFIEVLRVLSRAEKNVDRDNGSGKSHEG